MPFVNQSLAMINHLPYIYYLMQYKYYTIYNHSKSIIIQYSDNDACVFYVRTVEAHKTNYKCQKEHSHCSH